MKARRRPLFLLMAVIVVGVPLGAVPRSAAGADTVTYTATETIPVPPASTYAGSGG